MKVASVDRMMPLMMGTTSIEECELDLLSNSDYEIGVISN
jgi:hypothetical protein